MFEIINSPWEDRFISCVQNANENISICSPYVKFNVLKEVYKHKKNNVNFCLITNFNFASFYDHSSDINGMKYILENGDEITNYQSLHAKIYIFDKKSVVITSANLTKSGLAKNYEYGIFCDELSFVKKVCEDFDAILNSNQSGKISLQIIYDIINILNSIPRKQTIKLPYMERDYFNREEIELDKIYTDDIKAIQKGLSGWKLEIFNEVERLNKQYFELTELYKRKEYLKQKYPDNKFVEAKIRQQLQFLRDLGLIKFLGNGRYKKLWA